MDADRGTPLIGVTCCLRTAEGVPFHMVSDKYLAAIRGPAGGLPVLVAAIGEPPLPLLDHLDGLLLTGSPSNIEPRHYDGPTPPEDNITDPARDATTLPLIRAAIKAGMPVLGICRGLQELNVALGGTLHQELHKVAGKLDHRSDKTVPLLDRYRHAHAVALADGGFCAALAGMKEIRVNSLHGQGIERLAPSLVPDAFAPDGQIEAVRLPSAAHVVAVQWHPEWTLGQDLLSSALFQAFGDACRRYARQRGALAPAA